MSFGLMPIVEEGGTVRLGVRHRASCAVSVANHQKASRFKTWRQIGKDADAAVCTCGQDEIELGRAPNGNG